MTIKREVAVGSYDFQTLSARQSDGLAEFLRGAGYQLARSGQGGTGGLYRDGDEALRGEGEPVPPIRLGKLNGDGPPDMTVLALNRKADVATPDVFVTRPHIRYSQSSFFEDLKFAVTGDRENFQGRYIQNHPFKGEITCAEGKNHVTRTRERIREEAEPLRTLTGRSASNIASNIAKTVPKRYR